MGEEENEGRQPRAQERRGVLVPQPLPGMIPRLHIQALLVLAESVMGAAEMAAAGVVAGVAAEAKISQSRQEMVTCRTAVWWERIKMCTYTRRQRSKECYCCAVNYAACALTVMKTYAS